MMSGVLSELSAQINADSQGHKPILVDGRRPEKDRRPEKERRPEEDQKKKEDLSTGLDTTVALGSLLP